jgi:hypothetical protein
MQEQNEIGEKCRNGLIYFKEKIEVKILNFYMKQFKTAENSLSQSIQVSDGESIQDFVPRIQAIQTAESNALMLMKDAIKCYSDFIPVTPPEQQQLLSTYVQNMQRSYHKWEQIKNQQEER